MNSNAGTCADCHTWVGPPGSAHKPHLCYHLPGELRGVEQTIKELLERRDVLRFRMARRKVERETA